eukprot:TRINITY_DN545_c0_g1_i2.p1 TRINITY_DN545_c0_g1~~TRINITY_DN545_c0_g1_i2.p1  ORF type:complete len:864 (-),score=196.39 TRINITY_DN545_c0_g1_i2:1203-3794(-)
MEHGIIDLNQHSQGSDGEVAKMNQALNLEERQGVKNIQKVNGRFRGAAPISVCPSESISDSEHPNEDVTPSAVDRHIQAPQEQEPSKESPRGLELTRADTDDEPDTAKLEDAVITAICDWPRREISSNELVDYLVERGVVGNSSERKHRKRVTSAARRLVQQGLVEVVRRGNATIYHLAPAKDSTDGEDDDDDDDTESDTEPGTSGDRTNSSTTAVAESLVMLSTVRKQHALKKELILQVLSESGAAGLSIGQITEALAKRQNHSEPITESERKRTRETLSRMFRLGEITRLTKGLYARQGATESAAAASSDDTESDDHAESAEDDAEVAARAPSLDRKTRAVADAVVAIIKEAPDGSVRRPQLLAELRRLGKISVKKVSIAASARLNKALEFLCSSGVVRTVQQGVYELLAADKAETNSKPGESESDSDDDDNEASNGTPSSGASFRDVVSTVVESWRDREQFTTSELFAAVASIVPFGEPVSRADRERVGGTLRRLASKIGLHMLSRGVYSFRPCVDVESDETEAPAGDEQDAAEPSEAVADAKDVTWKDAIFAVLRRHSDGANRAQLLNELPSLAIKKTSNPLSRRERTSVDATLATMRKSGLLCRTDQGVYMLPAQPKRLVVSDDGMLEEDDVVVVPKPASDTGRRAAGKRQQPPPPPTVAAASGPARTESPESLVVAIMAVLSERASLADPATIRLRDLARLLREQGLPSERCSIDSVEAVIERDLSNLLPRTTKGVYSLEKLRPVDSNESQAASLDAGRVHSRSTVAAPAHPVALSSRRKSPPSNAASVAKTRTKHTVDEDEEPLSRKKSKEPAKVQEQAAPQPKAPKRRLQPETPSPLPASAADAPPRKRFRLSAG